MTKATLLYNAIKSYPWMFVLHAGPMSKYIGYRVVFFAKGCRYEDGQITYGSDLRQWGYTKDPGFIALAKSAVVSISGLR